MTSNLSASHAYRSLDPSRGPSRARISSLDMAPGSGFYESDRTAREPRATRRFITESHALGAPIARPGPLLVAASVAVAVIWIARRLLD